MDGEESYPPVLTLDLGSYQASFGVCMKLTGHAVADLMEVGHSRGVLSLRYNEGAGHPARLVDQFGDTVAHVRFNRVPFE